MKEKKAEVDSAAVEEIEILKGQEEDLVAAAMEEPKEARQELKVMMLLAINAAKRQQCHSSQQAVSQFTAGIALKETALENSQEKQGGLVRKPEKLDLAINPMN